MSIFWMPDVRDKGTPPEVDRALQRFRAGDPQCWVFMTI